MNLDEIREEIFKLPIDVRRIFLRDMSEESTESKAELSEEEEKELIQMRDDYLSGKAITYSQEVIDNDIKRILSQAR